MIRSVRVLTPNGNILHRSPKELYPLECQGTQSQAKVTDGIGQKSETGKTKPHSVELRQNPSRAAKTKAAVAIKEQLTDGETSETTTSVVGMSRIPVKGLREYRWTSRFGTVNWRWEDRRRPAIHVAATLK